MAVEEAALIEPPVGTLPEEVEYPSSDGVAFAETAWHATAKIRAQEALAQHFIDRLGVVVGCDMLMFYREGDNQASLAPDVYVAFGVGSHNRDNYRVWEEGKPPEFVLEVVSRGTLRRDLETKRDLYAAIGVGEHWLLDAKGLVQGDPKGPMRGERLAGSRLIRGIYQPIEAVVSADGLARFPSEALGLHLGVKQVGDAVVAEFWDPQSGCEVLTGSELFRELASIKKMLLDERARRIQAEERAEELAAKLAESTRRDDSNA